MKVPLARKTLVNEPDKNGETTAVVYELTKRTQEVLFQFGTIIKKHFLCPIRSQHLLDRLEMVW